ncbi:hypothetical protein BKA63DRAFT_497142 [Paraphoma chrysanthemicola]|nr:hypothetical protein BKA63DRAFT_497142 [Paraphoma chrysanthemicola]
MVSLKDVIASNGLIPTTLPKRLVAIFAGATTGIGESTLKTFVKYAVEPRIYLFARSPDSAARVIAACRQINPQGEYEFVKVDLSLIRETDAACEHVKSKEKLVNLLFLSAGEVSFNRTRTSEGLNLFLAASTYTRMRIVQNFLEPLKKAGETTGLARVVNVAGAGTEGKIDTSDIEAFKIPFTQLRPQLVSMHTLALESLAEHAPNVSFVHDYPGAVYTDLHKGAGGAMGWLMYFLLEGIHALLGRWLFVPIEESGERHIYLATSGRYAPHDGHEMGISQEKSTALRGSNGERGSGVYSVGWDGEGPAERSLVALKGLRANGVKELVWNHMKTEFDRIRGISSAQAIST